MTREEVTKRNHEFLDVIEAMLELKDMFSEQFVKHLEEKRVMLANITIAMDEHPDMIDHYIKYHNIVNSLIEAGHSEKDADILAFSYLEETDPDKIHDIGGYLFGREE